MKLEAISLFRILPAGAAEIGVSRQEMREAGVGSWSAGGGQRDDVSCLFDPEEFDEVMPSPEADEVTDARILKFG